MTRTSKAAHEAVSFAARVTLPHANDEPVALPTVGPADAPRDHDLEIAIGRQVRELRRRLELTVVELARLANLSAGMLSKIENGITSPSLATLQSLAQALNVPLTTLFRKFEDRRAAVLTPAGSGDVVERRATRPGLRYRHLGRVADDAVAVEPFVVEIDSAEMPLPTMQHEGIEFLHVLAGRLSYRHGETTYTLGVGDSLFYDADQQHGPVEFVELPVRLLVLTVCPGVG